MKDYARIGVVYYVIYDPTTIISKSKTRIFELKEKMDEFLAKHYGIEKNILMPWHYQDKFFQQGPSIYNVDLEEPINT